MSESQDTEIVLGTGKLLGLFFVLVILCGVFLSIGYGLGRSSVKPEGSLITDSSQTGATAPNGAKPLAGEPAPAKSSDCPQGQDCTNASTGTSTPPQDLTFYKSVEQKDPNAQLTPQNPSAAQQQQTPAAQPGTQQSQQVTSPVTSGYTVQVAAVSKKEDADLLRDALQAKQYPVLVTTAPNDKLFHVQVGPFATIQDADAMRSRLVGDGYNPIVKR